MAPPLTPMPIIAPQVMNNCHGSEMNTESTVPASRTVRQLRMVFFRPIASISPAVKGPTKPSSRRFSEIAAEMVATSQPKASRNGTMITPGALRTPTVPIMVTKVTPRAIQA